MKGNGQVRAIIDSTSVLSQKSADIPALQALRREALATAPWAFSASPDDDVARSREFLEQSLRSPTSVTFGAFQGDKLVGMVGISRESKLKYRHRVQIWGMYVHPQCAEKRAGRGTARSCT